MLPLLLFVALLPPAFAQSKATPKTPVAAPVSADSSATWQATLERVVPAVVAIRVSGTRSFDTEAASASVGTGFVVDAERGLILTNRHMVHVGPVVAEAVFYDHEEVPLQAVYRDPVHDFGLYRFDPKAVRFMEVKALPLYPEGAQVGVEIRVIGNDAGEKISILDGILARLDREAPVYGKGTYNDFNTFYIQAASGTSGGSSGSPVVDIQGRAVALNAGGRRNAASSYYLPLDRVVRAVNLIQQGQPVTRGTLQTVFVHTPFDELRRLGLSEASEALVRKAFPEGTGLLVVSETVPGGPGHKQLRPGDVLLRINGQLVSAFVPLDAALDDSVGKPLTLEVERGGQSVILELVPQDLHSISPSEYLEFSGGIIHPLSYQQARSYAVPAGGLYVASQGYALQEAGVPDGALITSVDGKPVTNLDELEAALAALPHGARVPLRYFPIQDPRQDQVAVLTVDRLWFPMQRCHRDDSTGRWPCTASPEPPPAPPPVAGNTRYVISGPRPARALTRSLALVEVKIPYRVEGLAATRFTGAGLVVDAEQGLVVVDRDTVPVGLGEISLVFAGSLRIPGEVVYVHPLHNLAVVHYDPALLGDTPVRSARLHPKELEPGDPIWQVGISSTHQIVSRRTQVSRLEPLYLPLPDPPTFREINLTTIDTVEAASSVGGALTDRRGRVIALWASFAASGGDGRDSFFRGLPIEEVQEILPALAAGQDPALRDLGVEFVAVPLADARDRGLSDARVQQLRDHDPRGGQALYVARVTAGTPADALLKGGDLLIEVDGQPVTRFAEVEDATNKEMVRLTVLRDGQELSLDVGTAVPDSRGVDRFVSWSGMVLHAPHRDIAAQRGLTPDGVYIAWYWYGSPAQRYGFRPTRRIVEVDGQPTPDLDSFLAIVSTKKDGEALRVTTVDLNEKTEVITLKVDLQYWPTLEFVRTDAGWESR